VVFPNRFDHHLRAEVPARHLHAPGLADGGMGDVRPGDLHCWCQNSETERLPGRSAAQTPTGQISRVAVV